MGQRLRETTSAEPPPRRVGSDTAVTRPFLPNSMAVTAEPEFIETYGDLLTPYGHTLAPSGDAFTSAAEIGAATAIEFGKKGRVTAVSEPTRRGGGSALVVSRKR